jgi:two-component system, NtrC family, nitrogen regulation sensor histidine kinase NtrY
MRSGMNRTIIFGAIAVVLFISALTWEHLAFRQSVDFQQIASEASAELTRLDLETQEFLHQFTQLAQNTTADNFPAWGKLYSRNSTDWYHIFVYKNDSLAWWSSNTVAPSGASIKPGITYFRNGWYLIQKEHWNQYTFVGMLLIKHQYSLQNRFLDTRFHPCFNISESTGITLTQDDESYTVSAGQQEKIFYLKFSGDQPLPNSLWIALLYICSYLIFVYVVFILARSSGASLLNSGLITIGVIVITRCVSLLFSFPKPLYDLPLFSPSYYASSFVLNSLGDLLVLSILLTSLVAILCTYSRNRFSEFRVGFAVLFVFGSLIWSVFINHLISGLIINSRISFNIINVFELDIYSLTGVFIIGILLASFYMICNSVADYLARAPGKSSSPAVAIAIGSVLFGFAVLWLRESWGWLALFKAPAFLLSVFLIVFIYYLKVNIQSLNVFTRYMLIIFGFSMYAALAVSTFNQTKEKENRKLLATKLENEQDRVAEYLFGDIAERISSDRIINGVFADPYEVLIQNVAANDIINRRLQQYYFTGYWAKYDITFRYFSREGLPINTGGDPSWNLDHFRNTIQREGQATSNPYLYFTGNQSGRISYVANIPVTDHKGEKTGTIIIQLQSKPLQDEGGFPELLLSDKVPQQKDISSYSYAYFRNGKLVNQAGEYNYRLESSFYESMLNSGLKEKFTVIDQYSHFLYRSTDDALLVVSMRNPGVLEFITLFSYLFTFFGLCFMALIAFMELIRNKGRVSLNFKNRIQATVVVVVVSTMLLIGGATVYYFFRNYVTNLGLNVNDRLRSMLIAIQDELTIRAFDESEISDELNYTFSKLATTLSIDFNIYSARGMLVYSTQPKIFDQGLMARTMNREALHQIATNNKSLFTQFEEIGSLRFLSAYEPIRNNNYQTVGFINIPYFARQEELQKDISSFLVALINIYVLLFAFSVFITFIISNRITSPLQLIQQRLAKIKLGKSNELIEWKHSDEIGALVNEYNRMVEELASSAEMLARSERESAWREMARQVAHEIKNPLTPMKLSVQHLQRAWKENSPNLDQIMQRFSQTLIEQIDALSNIANEFSNFAKMPRTKNEEVDIESVLQNTVSLYEGISNIQLILENRVEGPAMVFADKDQLLRIFSNLLKNAVQSIDMDAEGLIKVSMKRDHSSFIVSVEDNGSGISDEEKSRIFTPNFTTKTGGMGLGLAMVKSMVENAGGEVWFTSTQGHGSVFYVRLPAMTGDSVSDEV